MKFLAPFGSECQDGSWPIDGPISKLPTDYALIIDKKEPQRGDDRAEALAEAARADR